MKQNSRSSSKLSDARLKSLLKGLREDVAAPPGFSARVLASLRAEGLLVENPGSARDLGPSWLERVWAAFPAPRWALAAPVALALAVIAAVYGSPSIFRRALVPAPVACVSAPVHAPVLALARPARARALLALARPGSRPSGSAVRKTVSIETVVASSSPLGAGSAGARPMGGSIALASSSPAMGLGAAAPQTRAAQASVLVASSSFASLGAPSGGSAGTVGAGFGAASASPLDKGGPAATPTPQPLTPVPSLSQNSQVRNNVILASRGQNAQILFKVAESGQVLVAIYSRLGTRVAVLQNGPLGPGQYDLSWDGQAGFGGLAASGIYEVVIQTPTYTDLHKMMLVK